MGRVYSLTAGSNVSYDYDLRLGWRHVAAVREQNRLRLYIDGELAATSPSFHPDRYDLANRVPLKIGFGSVDYFSGVIDEVRVYGRALTRAEVGSVFRDTGDRP